MAATSTHTPTEEDWISHREQLTQWYQRDKKSLNEVMSMMREKHNFHAKKNQFEKYLHGRWKLCKKTKSQIWKTIAPVVHRLDREGQQYELWINGEKKSRQTVHKETSRYARTSEIITTNNSLNRLPPGVVIRQIVSRIQPPTATHLPFHDLEQRIHANLPIIWARGILRPPSPVLTTSGELSRPSIFSAQVLRTLQAASLSQSDLEMSSAGVEPIFNSQVLLSSVDHSILFSLANNLAGLDSLDAFNTPDPIIVSEIVSRQMVGASLRLLRSEMPCRSLRAIARVVYRSAIMAGDSGIVQSLLSRSIPGVEANCFFNSTTFGNQTPIEIAAQNQDKDLVRVLLRYKADPNLTYSGKSSSGLPRGALNTYIYRKRTGDLDQELIELLVDNKANLSVGRFKDLIERDQCGHSVALILFRDAATEHTTWISERIFHDIFRFQGPGILSLTLSIIREYNVDLNGGVNQYHWARMSDFSCNMGPPTLIDIIASRDERDIFEWLFTHGAQITAFTFLWAITSRSEDFVQWFLNRNLIANCTETYWESAMAIAIETGNLKIVELIEEKYAKYTRSLNVMLGKASQKSEWSLFEHFYKTYCSSAGKGPCSNSWKDEVDPQILDNALAYAITDGQDSIALELIEAGVDASCVHRSIRVWIPSIIIADMPEYDSTLDCVLLDYPLVGALKKRNALLVNTLLDAGAIPVISSTRNDEDSSLIHAVEWGDANILLRVIDAGAPIDTGSSLEARNIAITRRDKEMLDILLGAGVSINAQGVRVVPDGLRGQKKVCTALSAAVQTGDLAMVDHVIQAGADPHDPQALSLAFTKSPAMFDFVLQKHARRYLKGRKGWGGDILKMIVVTGDLESFTQMVYAGADVNELLDESDPYNGTIAEATTPGLFKIIHEPLYSPSFAGHRSAFGYAIAQSEAVGIKFAESLLQATQKTRCKTETLVFRLGKGSDAICQTAFLAAIVTSYIPTIELLIRHGADINFSTRHNIRRTPLQQAAEQGDLDVVRLLLEHGADVNAPAARRGGGTALQLSALQGFIQITLLLLNHGADVHAPASKAYGRTALEAASENGRLDTVALLLQYYGAYEAKNEKEFTSAVEYAEKNDFGYIAEMLREHQGLDSSSLDHQFLNTGFIEWEE